MDESLRCKKCDTPLEIISNYNVTDKIGLYTIQQLFCPICGKAHTEVTKDDQ